MTVLATNESLELLRSSVVGRLAVSITDHPDIFPINYVVDRGCIVFRTAEGTKLAAAVLGRGVAFEVDGYDQPTGEAWSVVVKGHAVEIEQMHDLFDAARPAVVLVARRTEAPLRADRTRRHLRSPVQRRRDARPSGPNDSAMSGTSRPPTTDVTMVARRGSTGELDRPPTCPKSDGPVADRTRADGPEHVTAAVAVGTVTLSWIPLGAGHHVVRASGKVFEALCAAVQRRHAHALYHSALEISVPGRPVHHRDGTHPRHARTVARRRRRRPGRHEMGGAVSGVPLRDPPLAGRRHPGRPTTRRRPWSSVWTSPARSGSWIWCHRYQRPSGAATSSTPARCGTRTR